MHALGRTISLSVAFLAIGTVTLFAGEHVHAGAPSADALWASLLAGNHRYVSGAIDYHHLRAQREAVADHQNPPVTILSCADSRVPPELIFDESVGDLFVVRVAGNVADPFELASLEFAIANGYTKLVVVMGHEACGAVKAAMAPDDPSTPSLVQLVTRIRESFEPAMDHDAKHAAALRHAIETNAKHTAAHLVAKSDVIRQAVADGKVKIIAAYYSFDGRVVRLE